MPPPSEVQAVPVSNEMHSLAREEQNDPKVSQGQETAMTMLQVEQDKPEIREEPKPDLNV